jgi:hypothetical protein
MGGSVSLEVVTIDAKIAVASQIYSDTFIYIERKNLDGWDQKARALAHARWLRPRARQEYA